MKKKYTTPTLDIVLVSSLQMLAASSQSSYIHRCSPFCRFWHICRDRDETGGKECSDFKFKT